MFHSAKPPLPSNNLGVTDNRGTTTQARPRLLGQALSQCATGRKDPEPSAVRSLGTRSLTTFPWLVSFGVNKTSAESGDDMGTRCSRTDDRCGRKSPWGKAKEGPLSGPVRWIWGKVRRKAEMWWGPSFVGFIRSRNGPVVGIMRPRRL